MEKIKQFGIYMIISFLLTAIFLCLSAVIFAYTNIEDRHLQTFVFGTILLSNLIGSTLLTRKIKEKGLIFGALFGMIYCLLLFFITSFMFDSFVITNTLGIYLLICAISGVIGGVIGVNISLA